MWLFQGDKASGSGDENPLGESWRKESGKGSLDEMQFGFRLRRGTIDAIFIVRQMQEKFLAKK